MPGVRLEHRQQGYPVRLEWGPAGVDLLAGECAAVIIIDVLSFCTSVDIAVERGAEVLPQRSGDRAAAARDAAGRGALPAGPRSGPGPSLRPSSLLELAAGTRLALPSPNGATLCAAAAGLGAVVFAGCLRNASAVAAAALAVGGRPLPAANPVVGATAEAGGEPAAATPSAGRPMWTGRVRPSADSTEGGAGGAIEGRAIEGGQAEGGLTGGGSIESGLTRGGVTGGGSIASGQAGGGQTGGGQTGGGVSTGGVIGLVPAGERWPDGTLRVAAEDLIGAGAIAAALPSADRSPEADLAVALFSAARDRGLPAVLAALSSGRELIADGFGPDVELAAAYDTSSLAPRLRDGLLTGH